MGDRVERRKYRRVKTRVQVDIHKHTPEDNDILTKRGTTRNVSAGGLLVHYDKVLEIPSYIIASFSLPGSQERLDFVAKVMRIEELMDGSYEIGISFMRMILGEFEKLGEYVAAQPDMSP